MSGILRRVREDRSGNFGLLMALLTVPVIVAVGAATDFSYALSVKKELQSAADSAAVASLAEQSSGVVASLRDGIMGEVEVADRDGEAIFRANTDPRIAAYITELGVRVDRDTNQFTSRVTYTARVPTSFLGIIGRHEIMVSGVATGSFVPATYVDFYLMLDNSPSMGLGATTEDIEGLQNATASMSSDRNCAFACHIEGSTSDRYTLAKSLGLTTRIQLVALAAQAMMSTAISTRKYGDQYRMAVYSMGAKATNAVLTTVAALSSDLDSVSSATGTIDLMSIPYQNYNNDQQTDLISNLEQLRVAMGTSGTGLSAADRQKVLFLVSDGVEDATRPTGCIKPLSGSTRCQAPLDFSVCSTIKDAGIRIAVLYTTYHPLETNDWYNTWIKPFRSEIATNMQSCASDNLYFEVSPSEGITEAMNALFLRTLNVPRLTG